MQQKRIQSTPENRLVDPVQTVQQDCKYTVGRDAITDSATLLS
jgi:hypothetical protein